MRMCCHNVCLDNSLCAVCDAGKDIKICTFCKENYCRPADTCGSEPGGSHEGMTLHGWCFSCDFWHEKVRWVNKPPRDVVLHKGVIIRQGGMHYIAYPKATTTDTWSLGFGGARFKFKLDDGTVVESNNVWCQGNWPVHFNELLKDNAERI